MGAEVRRVHSGTIDFSALTREHTVLLGTSDARDLVDGELTLYAEPSLHPLVDSQRLTGGEDFRLYLNEHDVTDALKAELAAALRLVPAHLVRERYLLGVERYLVFARSFSIFSSRLENEEQVAEEYASTEDWGEKLDSLGSRHVGWSGNLHVFSYLYRFIPLRPVSLHDVWSRYRDASDDGLPETLAELRPLFVTLSEGPAPRYEGVAPSDFLPAGRLNFQLELLHRNPLEPRLSQIASRLRTLAQQLEALRVTYLDPLSTDLQTLEQEFVQHTAATTESLKRVTETVENIA